METKDMTVSNEIKRVVDMCPFVGLSWEDTNGSLHTKGEGLTHAENDRLDKYFAEFAGMPFVRSKAITLAQMALDNKLTPSDFSPQD